MSRTSRERKFLGHFAPGSKNARERERGSKIAREWIGQGPIGRFTPRSELVWERKGCEWGCLYAGADARTVWGVLKQFTVRRLVSLTVITAIITSHARILVSGVWVDDGNWVNEPSSLILNVSIIDATQQWRSVNDWTSPVTVMERLPSWTATLTLTTNPNSNPYLGRSDMVALPQWLAGVCPCSFIRLQFSVRRRGWRRRPNEHHQWRKHA